MQTGILEMQADAYCRASMDEKSATRAVTKRGSSQRDTAHNTGNDGEAEEQIS